MFLEQWRMSEKFLYLDQQWWKMDKDLANQYLDIADFEAKRSQFTVSMNRLLGHALIDLNVVQPHVEKESELGLNKRALFGLKIKVDRLDNKPSNSAIKQLRDFVIKNRDIARQDFDGYEYDSQEVYGDAVNFVDFMLALRLI